MIKKIIVRDNVSTNEKKWNETFTISNIMFYDLSYDFVFFFSIMCTVRYQTVQYGTSLLHTFRTYSKKTTVVVHKVNFNTIFFKFFLPSFSRLFQIQYIWTIRYRRSKWRSIELWAALLVQFYASETLREVYQYIDRIYIYIIDSIGILTDSTEHLQWESLTI